MDENAWWYLVGGIAIGLFLNGIVLEALRSLRFFASQFDDFSADGTYADANLDGVLRRNAEVRSLWMNLGYSEDPNAMPHYAAAASALAKKLGERADLASATRCCDVGYGYGDQDLLWAGALYPKLRIVGYNVGAAQAAVAAKRVAAAGLSARVDLRVGSATALPLPDASVDRVTSLESAFHYDTREAFFREAYRALEPGGVLAVADFVYEARPWPAWFEFRYPLSFALHVILLKCRPHVPRANVYGLADLEARLASAGFESVSSEDVSDRVCIWNNGRSRRLLKGWARPLRHPSRLWPSPLERLLGRAVSAVDGAAWNLYCFTCLNLTGLRYVIYTAVKPAD